MKRFWVFLLLMVVVSFGCKQRVVTQPEAQQQTYQKEQQTREEAGKEKTAPESVTEKKTPSETVESRERLSKSTEEGEGKFKDVLFDFDRYNVRDAYKPELKSVAAWMSKNSDAMLSVEGHCDERGTSEYNLALGERRAKAVKDYLASLGVPSSRIETISFGSEKPSCGDHSEDCWAKNRRAHFVILSRSKK